MANAILRGKPDAGNPHVRFDEGEVASENPRRGSLLYNSLTDRVPTASYADGRVTVLLPNGVSFSFPIVGNWRLEDATPDQLNNMEVDEDGIHWPDIDEDLSFEGLLNGDWGQFIRRRQFA